MKEVFEIRLAYSESKLREKVKKMGGKWNPDKKTWSLSCEKNDLGVLESKIATNETPSVNRPKTFNTGLGYYGTAADAARGYDGIE